MARTRSKIPVAHAPTAYSYLRFSSPEQAKGDSLRRQSELRDAWLAKSGAVLDTSLTLRDEGVSGFTGNHRENPDRHALATFLELVKTGRIPKGSFLIVESLDRLSREHIRPALTLLLNLIESGIRVVQLLPDEQVFDENVEPMALMMAIMELSRGHAESRMKSERIGRAWTEKKRLATAEKKILTKRAPAWLKVEDGKFAIVPEAAATVHRIYRMAIDGKGIGAIVRAFNAEGVPSLAKRDYWYNSYVLKILSNPAVYGEYQPFKGHGWKGRKPDGSPIPGYYPAIIPEAEYHLARSILQGRKQPSGPAGKQVYLFSGLAKDARDSSTLHRTNKGTKGSPLLVSSKAIAGRPGSEYVSFPLEAFERSLLEKLREIDPQSILPGSNEWAERLMTLSARVADLDARIEKIKAALKSNGDVMALVDVLRDLEAEKAATSNDLSRARREAASPVSEAWGEYRSLVDAIDDAADQGDLRVKIRSAIRRMVKEVLCVFAKSGRVRLAVVQVWFAEGGHRDYFIRAEPSHGNASARRPAVRGVVSTSTVPGLGELDLRNPDDAKEVAKVLPLIGAAKE